MTGGWVDQTRYDPYLKVHSEVNFTTGNQELREDPELDNDGYTL